MTRIKIYILSISRFFKIIVNELTPFSIESDQNDGNAIYHPKQELIRNNKLIFIMHISFNYMIHEHFQTLTIHSEYFVNILIKWTNFHFFSVCISDAFRQRFNSNNQNIFFSNLRADI